MLLPPPPPTMAPQSYDLFLVGSNPVVATDFTRIDGKAEPAAPVENVLRAVLAPYIAGKKSFVVIDGGDGSLFPPHKDWHNVGFADRRYASEDTATESVTRHGKTTTRVVQHTESTTTESGTIGIREFGPAGYVAQSFVWPEGGGKDRPVVALMDLNSYRNTLSRGTEDDRKALGQALLLSFDSVWDTERELRASGLKPPGPVLCRTGMPTSRDRNVIAFPPEGVVAQYRLVRDGGGWKLSFVRFYRS